MKTSKLLLFASLALALSLGFLACEKEHEPKPEKTYPIAGLWIGTYTVHDPSIGEQYFSFVIKPDGGLIVDSKGDDQQHLAIGTWSVTGTTFTAEYTYVYGIASNVSVTQTATAEWDATGKLTGTWMNVSPEDSGTFKMERVN